MSVAIKLCGINTPEAAHVVAVLGVEYMGIVCYPPSPRHVAPEQAAAVKAGLGNANTKTIAVVVDPDDKLLEELVRELKPEGLQLHGNESPARMAEIRARFRKLLLIKAIGVHAPADVAKAQHYPQANAFLFDAKSPCHGGTGQPFDWTLLSNYKDARPWFLSGGLNEANVRDAIKITGARAVDVSSGIESAPGVKSEAKMRAFVSKIR